jgi:hypothetical protein
VTFDGLKVGLQIIKKTAHLFGERTSKGSGDLSGAFFNDSLNGRPLFQAYYLTCDLDKLPNDMIKLFLVDFVVFFQVVVFYYLIELFLDLKYWVNYGAFNLLSSHRFLV